MQRFSCKYVLPFGEIIIPWTNQYSGFVRAYQSSLTKLLILQKAEGESQKLSHIGYLDLLTVLTVLTVLSHTHSASAALKYPLCPNCRKLAPSPRSSSGPAAEGLEEEEEKEED